MKIFNLTDKNGSIYTSNVYFIRGDMNALNDVNTIVDVGRDPSIIKKIWTSSTGVGKKTVAKVILTHNHYDHASLLPEIRKEFNPEVYAFSKLDNLVDILVKDGDALKIGDRMFEVIHIPGHSADSICLYCEEEKILFAGDTPVAIYEKGRNYEDSFVQAFIKLGDRDIQDIYLGHGDPITGYGNKIIRHSLLNLGIKKVFKLQAC